MCTKCKCSHFDQRNVTYMDLMLYILRAIVLYMQVYCQLNAQLVLLLLMFQLQVTAIFRELQELKMCTACYTGCQV